jgi:hypothetical protein
MVFEMARSLKTDASKQPFEEKKVLGYLYLCSVGVTLKQRA